VTIKVAIPNKGQLSEPARQMLREAGYLRAAGQRELMVHDPDNDVDFFFLRPKDIATYVGNGKAVTNMPGGAVKKINWKKMNSWGYYLGWAEPYYG